MGLIEEELELSHKYELEAENLENGEKLVKLTRENVAKVEAMINANSDYKDSKNEKKIYKKDKNEKVIQNGSSTYWLKQLKELIDTKESITKKGYDYQKIINHLVIAIDNENSTHLNSDKIGRKAVAERISNINIAKLIEYLKFPGTEYELINIIKNPKEKNEHQHFSFATKFCHYTALYLFKGTEYADNFSIYDSIIKKNLPKYKKWYLNSENEDEKINYENNYHKFISDIDEIRKNACNKYKCEISRNGFDRLIWYFHK